jgi:O-antigen/teichoic acid export membrane protein
LLWFPTNIYFMLLPAFAGLASAAALKATLNMVMPILHFNGALGTLLLTALATRVQHRSQFNRLVLVGLAAFTGGSVVYWSLLTTFRHSIIDWLYRGTYVESAFVVPIIALVPFTAAYSIVFGSALRALEQPRQVFWAHLGSAAVTLTLGIWATAVWGLAGAAAAILVASATIAVVCGVFLMRYMRAGQTQLAQTSVEEGR